MRPRLKICQDRRNESSDRFDHDVPGFIVGVVQVVSRPDVRGGGVGVPVKHRIA